MIPEEYVSNISERLGLYAKLDGIKNEAELEKFASMLTDRFGPIPEVVNELMETVRLRWIAEKLGIEKLVLKSGQMKCHLLPSSKADYYSSEVFGKIMRFAQSLPKKCKIKEYKNRLILTISEVTSISKAEIRLKEMQNQ